MARAADRTEFQGLALARLREARVLLAAGHLPGAYYLAGYAVECGLKACICRRRMRRAVFPDKEFARAVYTHRLEELVKLADLEHLRESWTVTHPKFAARWAVVARWTEQVRYEVSVTEKDARELVDAIGAARLGVLTWLKRHW